MLIRQLIVAALAASACAAYADVLPAAPSTGTSSGILSGWTGANGADVLGSGVLSGNFSLVGGISYAEASKASGAAGSATLADVLYGKASASVAQTADGQTQLFYKQGIEGMYLLGAGHGILAAMLGNGVSVVGSAGGVTVSQGVGGTGSPMSGHGAAVSGGGSTAVGSFGGGGTGGSGGTGGTGGSGGGFTGTAGGTGGGSIGASAGGSTASPGGGSIAGELGGGSGTSTGGSTSIGATGNNVVPVPAEIPPLALDQVQAEAPNGSVPEPSSIALIMAGLFGAGRLVRRRRG